MIDEERGRKVEDDIKRERGSWEAAYGTGEANLSILSQAMEPMNRVLERVR